MNRLTSLFLLLTCGAAIASGAESTRPQQMAVYRSAKFKELFGG